jgi:hypothetical protein
MVRAMVAASSAPIGDFSSMSVQSRPCGGRRAGGRRGHRRVFLERLRHGAQRGHPLSPVSIFFFIDPEIEDEEDVGLGMRRCPPATKRR